MEIHDVCIKIVSAPDIQLVFGVALIILRLYRLIIRKKTIDENASALNLYLMQWIIVKATPKTRKAIATPVYVPQIG